MDTMSVGSKPMMCMEKSGKTVLGQVIGINYHLSSFTHNGHEKWGGLRITVLLPMSRKETFMPEGLLG